MSNRIFEISPLIPNPNPGESGVSAASVPKPEPILCRSVVGRGPSPVHKRAGEAPRKRGRGEVCKQRPKRADWRGRGKLGIKSERGKSVCSPLLPLLSTYRRQQLSFAPAEKYIRRQKMEIPQPEYRRGISLSLPPSSLPLFPFPVGLGKTIRRPVGRSVFGPRRRRRETMIRDASSSPLPPPPPPQTIPSPSPSVGCHRPAGPPTKGTWPPKPPPPPRNASIVSKDGSEIPQLAFMVFSSQYL